MQATNPKKNPTRTTKLNQKLVVFPATAAESLGSTENLPEIATGLFAADETGDFYLGDEETNKAVASAAAVVPSSSTAPLRRVTGYCTGR